MSKPTSTSTPVFQYTHVWVNRGEWQQGTREGEAIEAARTAASRRNLWDATYEANKIVLDLLPCPNRAHVNVCSHILVSFYRTEVSDAK